MQITDDVLCLFSARVTERDGSYVVEIPERELALGAVDEDGTYRVALADAGTSTDDTDARTSTAGSNARPSTDHTTARAPTDGQRPPVEEGERRRVEIVDIGEQGDGIARVERGYVLIVPGTEMRERVTVRVTDVKENLAFSEVVERGDYYE